MSDVVIGGVMAQEVEVLTRELAAERAMRKSYEEGITWETSCLGCARSLTLLRASEERAERAIDAAFARGAEAMREAAAREIGGFWQIYGSQAEERIRALPLPTSGTAPRLVEDPSPEDLAGIERQRARIAATRPGEFVPKNAAFLAILRAGIAALDAQHATPSTGAST
jgi:hypothetical protein